jgi:hypothetical protein
MKKAVLIGLVALLLASSLAFVSCGGGDGGSNAFVGTWVTSQLHISGTLSPPASLKFTGSEWALTVPSLSITEKGNYTVQSNWSDNAFLYKNGSAVGQATILNNSLSLTFVVPGPLKGSSGEFTKQ